MSFEYAWYIQLQGWIDFFFFFFPVVGFCTPSPGWNGGLCSRRSSHPYLLHCQWTALIPRDRCWLPSGAMSRGDPYFTICSDKRGRHGRQRCGKDQGTTVRVNAKVGCGGNRSPWLFKEAHGRKRGVWARHRKARKRRRFSPACLPWVPNLQRGQDRRISYKKDPNFCFAKRVLKHNCTKSDAFTPRLLSRLSTMSVLQRLAERLFHRAGPCLGDSSGGEGGYYQSQDESEASCWSEWLTWGIMWVKTAGTVSVWI